MKWSAIGRSLSVAKKALPGWLLGVVLWIGLAGKSYAFLNANNVVNTSGAPVSFSSSFPTFVVTQSGSPNARSIINWGDNGFPSPGFNIFSGETVQFNQPGQRAAILNRDISGFGSFIDGTINANGQVYVINTVGITIGAHAVITAFSFGASTFDISDNDFLTPGPVVKLFAPGGGATLTVSGTINGSNSGGHVVLIGGGSGTGSTGLDISGATIDASYVGLAAPNGPLFINLVGTYPVLDPNLVSPPVGNTHLKTQFPGTELFIDNSTITASNGFTGGQIDVLGGDVFLGTAGIGTASLIADGSAGAGAINIVGNSPNVGVSLDDAFLDASSNFGKGGTIAIRSAFGYFDTGSTFVFATGFSTQGQTFIEAPFVVDGNGFYSPSPTFISP